LVKKIYKNEGELENICWSLVNREAALLSRTALIKLTRGEKIEGREARFFADFLYKSLKDYMQSCDRRRRRAEPRFAC
jgi:hypothetical protein